jgi:beta-aspartyl-peptidase (threonine type)
MSSTRNYTIAIHGGAGAVPIDYLNKNRTSYEEILRDAAELGAGLLAKGLEAADVVTQVVVFLEDCDKFNAGKGSVIDNDGNVSMDAAFADGKTSTYGGVINVKLVKNPIKLAQKLALYKEHNIISGEGAAIFAKEHGLEFVPMDYFLTDYRKKQWEKAQKTDSFCLDHFDEKAVKNQADDSKYGTVGAVAKDIYGNLASATSTGGITNKKYGRVGDSPILGAGTYANNETVAISATGRGEEFTQKMVSADLHFKMKYLNQGLEEAANEIVESGLTKGSGGIIAVDTLGNVAMPFNTKMMFRASANEKGVTEIGIE